jgi:hypothetical protein
MTGKRYLIVGRLVLILVDFRSFHHRGITVRVTLQAGVVIVTIPWNPVMLIIHFGLAVASEAAEHLVIVWIGMAIRTKVPLSVVFPGVDRKILTVMVERRRYPCVLRMADFAIGWELSGGVRRIVRLVVIVQVAAHACVRYVIIVIAVMAGIARLSYVGPGKYVIIIVIREQGRLPARVCGMAGCTIGGQTKCSVTGIGGLIVFVLMAADAGIRSIVVIVLVAAEAVNGCMGACQRVIIIMLWKNSRCPPGSRTVAVSACGGYTRR